MIIRKVKFINIILPIVIIIGSACQREYSSERLVGVDENVFPEMSEKVKILEERIALNPNNAENYFLKAEVLHENGDYTEALQQIDKAIALDSTQGSYFLLKSDILFEKGFITRSLFFALKAESSLPLSPELKSVMAKNYLGLEKPSLARSSIDDAKKLQPENARFYMLSGEIALVEGDTNRAISEFNKSIELDENLISGPMKLIRISLDQGDTKKALKYFDQFPSSSLESNPELRYLYLRTRLANGDEKYFFQEVDSLEGRYKYFSELNKLAGDRLVNTGKYYSALQYYNKVPERNEVWLDASLSKANALSVLGKSKESLETYNQILERFPDNEEAQAGKEAIEEKIALYLRWKQRQLRNDSISSLPLQPKNIDLN
ncbi:tetratricopeptide repeat protein [Marinigracilibium pacificum]|uniref:Tetratricopeptide repeat protein n=1 Tax=Marinigracilibium pacificum TaxID=2729599 RepID=A0A848J7H3_9BACT|nr:tetratricopeptide repeat protein [Marinigracilibium pacificum]NMM50440.1 tetratricopeptide repeat protein [Marinigracilibium pacificum]